MSHLISHYLRFLLPFDGGINMIDFVCTFKPEFRWYDVALSPAKMDAIHFWIDEFVTYWHWIEWAWKGSFYFLVLKKEKKFMGTPVGTVYMSQLVSTNALL